MIKSISQSFTKHPASVGETYFEHMGMSLGFGFKMIINGLACLIHALLPFCCEKTGSSAVAELYGSMVTHRDKRAEID